MKVVCIDDNIQVVRRCKKSIIRFGNIYTVIDIQTDEKGEWYELAEDIGYEYQANAFAPISEIDETEFIREYKKELV